MISLGQLSEQIARELSVSGSVYEQHFVAAVRAVCRDFNRDCFLEIDYDDVTAPSGDLDLDEKYLDALVAGVRYRLQQIPIFAKKSENDYYQTYRREMALAQCIAIKEADPETGVPENDEDEE